MNQILPEDKILTAIQQRMAQLASSEALFTHFVSAYACKHRTDYPTALKCILGTLKEAEKRAFEAGDLTPQHKTSCTEEDFVEKMNVLRPYINKVRHEQLDDIWREAYHLLMRSKLLFLKQRSHKGELNYYSVFNIIGAFKKVPNFFLKSKQTTDAALIALFIEDIHYRETIRTGRNRNHEKMQEIFGESRTIAEIIMRNFDHKNQFSGK